MAKFEDAIGYVLSAEGYHSNHPRDPGGETYWGISLRFLQGEGIDIDRDGDSDLDDLRALTRADAIAIYATKFWKPLALDKIVSQAVATRVLDMAVNMGLKRAVKILQKAANSLKGDAERLKVDGKLGPKTRGLVNALEPVGLMAELRSEHAAYYKALVERCPDLGCFLDGWLHRAAR